jgi:hypothetical protein
MTPCVTYHLCWCDAHSFATHFEIVILSEAKDLLYFVCGGLPESADRQRAFRRWDPGIELTTNCYAPSQHEI